MSTNQLFGIIICLVILFILWNVITMVMVNVLSLENKPENTPLNWLLMGNKDALTKDKGPLIMVSVISALLCCILGFVCKKYYFKEKQSNSSEVTEIKIYDKEQEDKVNPILKNNINLVNTLEPPMLEKPLINDNEYEMQNLMANKEKNKRPNNVTIDDVIMF